MSKGIGTIAILGSGETSPNLVSVHRELLKNISKPNAYIIDSPFGFQENADLLVEKLKQFFKTSVGLKINLASFRSIDELNKPKYFKALKELENANFIFAGPGSPSYASKMWVGNQFQDLLKQHLLSGNNAVFASAAAATLGKFTLPVYEIYKAGFEPYWEKGMSLLNIYNLDCTVIPHFNNREGGNHDTSYSFVGRKRIELLIKQNYTNILGVDEHTALVIDGENNIFKVYGKGNVTFINRNEQIVFKPGSENQLKLIQDFLENTDESVENLESKDENQPSLDLEKTIAELLIEVELNKKNISRFEFLITELIKLRIQLRNEKKYEISDSIRILLESANIQISDLKDEIKWTIKE